MTKEVNYKNREKISILRKIAKKGREEEKKRYSHAFSSHCPLSLSLTRFSSLLMHTEQKKMDERAEKVVSVKERRDGWREKDRVEARIDKH